MRATGFEPECPAGQLFNKAEKSRRSHSRVFRFVEGSILSLLGFMVIACREGVPI